MNFNFEFDILSAGVILIIAFWSGFYYHIHTRMNALSKEIGSIKKDFKHLKDITINGKLDAIQKEIKEHHIEMIKIVNKLDKRITVLENKKN